MSPQENAIVPKTTCKKFDLLALAFKTPIPNDRKKGTPSMTTRGRMEFAI